MRLRVNQQQQSIGKEGIVIMDPNCVQYGVKWERRSENEDLKACSQSKM